MSLPHILLGLLKERQAGYDIKKTFGQSLQHFWHAELSQIYPALQRLEREGWVTCREGISRAGPPRKEYKRTAQGRKELLRWLGDGPVTGTERIAYLAQVYFLDQAQDEKQALKYFSELRTHMANWLETLQDIERQWRDDDPRYPDQLPAEAFYPQLTLALGLKKVRANLEWCEESMVRIEARDAG